MSGRINEARLREIPLDNSQYDEAIPALIHEIRRLRGILARMAEQLELTSSVGSSWCPVCAGQKSHVDGCAWAELKAEATAVQLEGLIARSAMEEKNRT